MKTVLITGASSGFGEATAKLLAGEGYRLILLARRLDRLKELKRLLGSNVHVVGVDVTDKGQVKTFFDKLPKKYKDVDVLVNNAGLAAGMATAQDADIEDWEQMVDTNIKGLLYVTRHALEGMKKRGKGSIINIGSIAATVPYKGNNVYGATKAFVRQFSRNLRTDLFGTDIKVTNIEPGKSETELSVVRYKGDVVRAHAVYEGMRALTPKDIASTIAWVVNQPAHVNIDTIEIMPLDHTFGGVAINRR